MQVTDAMVAAAFDAYSRDTVHGLDGKMRAALEAALAEMWRPIEEAPKDGTTVLVFGKPRDIDGIRFLKSSPHTAYWDEIDQSFCLTGSTWIGPFIDPTHFMPLPPPPRGK